MLGWEYPPRISGGLGTACRGIVRALSARGVEVLFVLPRAFGDEDGGGARIRSVTRRSGRRAAPRELALASPLRPYLDAPAYRALAVRGGYGPDLQAEVERYAECALESCSKERFDLVHAHDWMTYPAGLRLREALDRPLVCHVHACEYDRSLAHPDPRILEVERRALLESDRVVCVSRYTADVLRSRYPFDDEKLRVVHNGVDLPKNSGAPAVRERAEPVVLFLGRLTAQKGPLQFLEAAALVLREEPFVSFVVCGQGDQLPELVERAAELGIARSLHFTGFLERPAVERMYALADVYVMPSVSEPFGLAPLEAAARGAAVIVSRQSGVTEVLKSALRVDHWDTEGLARRILLLVRQPLLRATLARGARRELAGLSWGRAARALQRVYGEVAA